MGPTKSASQKLAVLCLTVGLLAACEDPVRTTAGLQIDETASLDAPPADMLSRDAPTRSDPLSLAPTNASVQVREFVLASRSPIEIDGAPSLATVVLSSSAPRSRATFYWFLDVRQGNSWVEGAWGYVDCGAGTGVLPPGRCALRNLSFVASHAGRHIGTLVPGAATLSFELFQMRDGRAIPAALATIPVVLTATSGASSVIVTPPQVEWATPGSSMQLTATVLPVGGPQGVNWSSSNPLVATISSTGLATGVAPGAALVIASSVANPTAQGSSLISVGTTPAFGSGVNVSPGEWDAVPGMQLRFAAQVTNGAQGVTWTSDNPSLVTVDPTGVATVGATTTFSSATITARSVADGASSADVGVRVFTLSWFFPTAPVFVSTGAVTPSANPLSVQLRTRACNAPNLPFTQLQGATYEVQSASAWIPIGRSTSFLIVDNGVTRCWIYAMNWTPGTAFGTGPQTLRTTVVDQFGTLGSYVTNNFVTITTP